MIALAPHLPILTQLRSFNVSCNWFDSVGMGALSTLLPQLTSLTSINVWGIQEMPGSGPESNGPGTHGFLIALSQVTSLTSLCLAHNAFGDVLCAILGASLFHLHQLQRLRLGSMSISDSGCITLSSFGW